MSEGFTENAAKRTRICRPYSRLSSIRKPADFRQMYRKGRRFAGSELLLFVRRNDLSENRLGITVSKKNGNSAVRHRFSRLVKEVFRLQRDTLGTGRDFLVVMKREVKIETPSSLTFSAMQKELLPLLDRSKGTI